MSREYRTCVHQKRMIGTFSHRLLHTLVVRGNDLNTARCETEGILNSRPITHVSYDAGDIEALTPNHLFLLRANLSYEDSVVRC